MATLARRRERRADGRVHPNGRRQPDPLRRPPRRPRVHTLPRAATTARRDELPHGADDPELLDLRAPVRVAGPDVRAGRLVDAARAPVPRVCLGGELRQPSRSDELRVGSRAERRGAGPAFPRGRSDLGVDRHHAPAARGRGELVVLRRRRHVRVRSLPERPERTAHREPAESASVVHDRPPEPSARSRPGPLGVLCGGGERTVAVGVVGDAVLGRRRASRRRRADMERAATRDERRQRGDARARLGADGDLLDVGRLGWLLRPRGATVVSIATGTASAFRGS